MAELPARPADEDWRATALEQIEQMKTYIVVKYGSDGEQGHADWYTGRA